LKIGFIITGLNIGGAELALLKLIRASDRSKHAYFVVSLSSRGEVGELISDLGVQVIPLGMSPGKFSISALIELVRIIKVQKPDIVHTWMYHADILGGIAARLAGVKILVWGVRNSDVTSSEVKRSTRFIVKACAVLSKRLPDGIICCAKSSAGAHIKIGYEPTKIVVIPNGFDCSRFRPDIAAREAIRAELEIDQSIRLVGLVARSDPIKNHAGFLHAASRVSLVAPEAHYLFVGEGMNGSDKDLANLVTEYGLSGKVHWLGIRADVNRVIASLDVLVSSSNSEAFPNVIGEAMASEVVCAVTAAGDSKELLDLAGICVNIGDMNALADAILKILLMSPEERRIVGEYGRRRIVSKFNIDSMASRYENYYKRLVTIRKI
jgi:glycosyltransferase involved in cell wall biosynthesis